MLTYEYKIDGTSRQYAAIDEAIRIVQFVRNKCLRLWMDRRGTNKNDLQCSCAPLAQSYPFARRLNSQARQASASRAWFAIERFYENCKQKKPGKKGYPRFQHDNRSVEYKQTGWKLEPDGRHITFTDGCGIGRLRLIGNKDQQIEAFPIKQIKRVRIVRRADGYYAQFAVKTERKIEHTPTGNIRGIDVGRKRVPDRLRWEHGRQSETLSHSRETTETPPQKTFSQTEALCQQEESKEGACQAAFEGATAARGFCQKAGKRACHVLRPDCL